MKLEFSDYSPDSNKLGIFFYDKPIYISASNDSIARDYKFIVEVYSSSHEITETIKCVCRLNLNDYLTSVSYEESTWQDFEWEKFLIEKFPKDLEYAKLRLERKELPYTLDYQSAKKISFLEFTEETAHIWAGPYTEDDKEGCHVEIKKLKTSRYPIANPNEFCSYYDWPSSARDKLKEMADGYKGGDANFFYHIAKTKEGRKKLWSLLSVREKHDAAIKYWNYYFWREYLERALPYEIHLSGNDDCSYSKWFATEEEVAAEMSYLVKMQPLDFCKDIAEREYIFTN